MQEIWKDIKGYEGLYEISNYGNVKSCEKKRNNSNAILKSKNLKLSINSDGYKIVKLYKATNKKSISVHRLVAEHFIDNIELDLQVNHIDCNKQNNHVSNLEWVTQSENIIHAFDNGLNKTKKYLCSSGELNERIMFMLHTHTIKEISDILKCSSFTVKRYIKINKIKKKRVYKKCKIL